MEALQVTQTIMDDYSARILLGTFERPASAIELGRRFGIPIAACYRRIKQLEGLGLLYGERAEPSRNGRGLQLYRSRLRSVQIAIEDGQLRARIVLTPMGVAASKPPRPVVSSLRRIPTCDSIALRPPTNPSRLSGCTRSRWIWSKAIRGNAFRRNGTSKREPLKVTRSFARSIAAGRSSRLSPWTKDRLLVPSNTPTTVTASRPIDSPVVSMSRYAIAFANSGQARQ